MSVRARIALLVQAQGARKASSDVDGVAKSTDKLDRKTRSAGKSMRGAKSEAEGFHTTLRDLRRGLAVGAIAASGFAAAIGAHAVAEYREAIKVGRQTDAVLRSTGAAANVSAQQVSDLANAISLKTGIDDDQIQAGENLLLTFTRIRNEVGKGNNIFDQATQAATDMSAAMHTDLRSAALSVGKALNDPLRGMTALQRVGVSFSKSSKDQVKQWVATGQTMKAQKLILRELNKEFAGSAAAQADPFDKATVAINEVAEALGFLIGPALGRGADSVAKFAQQIQTGVGAGGEFKRIFIGAGSAIVDVGRAAGDAARWVVGVVQDFRAGKPAAVALGIVLAGLVTGFAAFRILTGVIAAFKAMRTAVIGVNVAMAANPVVLVVAALAALGAALYVAYQKVGWFRDGVNAVFGFLKAHWPLILGVLTGGLGIAVGYVIKNFGRIVSFVKSMPGKIRDAARGMWDGLKDAFRGALNWIIAKWNGFEIGFGPVVVPGPLPDIPKMAIGTPDIPMLAEGGRVSGSGSVITGDAGMERVDKMPNGDIQVTPLEHVPGGRGTGPVLQLSIPVQIEGRTIATATRRVALRDLLAQAAV